MEVDAPDAPGTLPHYSLCARTEQCLPGDVCMYWWPSTLPLPTPPPASYCQPPCATDADCATDAYGNPDFGGMCDDTGRCTLYCASGGLVPTCVGPYWCEYFNPDSRRDGYCVLDPDAPPPFDAGPPPDTGPDAPDAPVSRSSCVGPACPLSLSVGAIGACVVRADGAPRCWGLEGNGEITGLLPADGLPWADILEASTVAGFPSSVESIEVGNSMGASVGGFAWHWGTHAMREPTPDGNNLPRFLEGGERTFQLAIADWHVCSRRFDGSVACFGRNTAGELGDGTLTTRLTPLAVPGLTDVTQVATGTSGDDGSSCALHSDGSVECWGHLPSGTATTPTLLDGAGPAMELALGAAPDTANGHFHAVLRDGTVVGWGENARSELGLATPSLVLDPTPIPGLPSIVDVAAGARHACALAMDGSVWCWGSNDRGQVGTGASSSCAGTPCVHTPVLVSGLSDVIAMDAGGDRTCAVDVAGDVWCWGAGPLGDGSPPTTSSPTATRVVLR